MLNSEALHIVTAKGEETLYQIRPMSYNTLNRDILACKIYFIQRYARYRLVETLCKKIVKCYLVTLLLLEFLKYNTYEALSDNVNKKIAYIKII